MRSEGKSHCHHRRPKSFQLRITSVGIVRVEVIVGRLPLNLPVKHSAAAQLPVFPAVKPVPVALVIDHLLYLARVHPELIL